MSDGPEARRDRRTTSPLPTGNTCSACRNKVSVDATLCPSCGHALVARGKWVTAPGAKAASVISFLLPGVGQLIQGKRLLAILLFSSAVVLWFAFLGWIVHCAAAYDAATFKEYRRIA